MESTKRRKVVSSSKGRQMVASVYHFLKTEYEFTEFYKKPNNDFSHLRNICKRTGEATGISERTVQRILREERDLAKSLPSSPPMRQRQATDIVSRQMIASVYHFLKAEHVFTEAHKEPNCDLSHLRNITKRTAAATGVGESTVSRVLKEERDGTLNKPKSTEKKRKKEDGKKQQNIDDEADTEHGVKQQNVNKDDEVVTGVEETEQIFIKEERDSDSDNS